MNKLHNDISKLKRENSNLKAKLTSALCRPKLINKIKPLAPRQIIVEKLIENDNRSHFTADNKLFQNLKVNNNVKICVILHVGNPDIGREILITLKNIPYNYDLYLTYDESCNLNFLHHTKHSGLFECWPVPNKGADTGPFIWVLNKLFNKGLSYDYLLKLHTKSDKKWRDDMIWPLCGCIRNAYCCIQTLITDDNIGLIGSDEFVLGSDHISYDAGTENLSKKMYKEHFPKLKWEDTRGSNFKFVGGTCWWSRWNVMEKIWKNVDIPCIYNNMEAYNRNVAQHAHVLERLFGWLICHEKLRIESI